MNSQERIATIRKRLEAAFKPQQLEILDDSENHMGHAGAEGGAGHYTVLITADSLTQQSRVEAHRQIYEVLLDLMPHEIHALKITLIRK
jgi:BolA family transcriptional regulator, general stress-responsive regulator